MQVLESLIQNLKLIINGSANIEWDPFSMVEVWAKVLNQIDLRLKCFDSGFVCFSKIIHADLWFCSVEFRNELKIIFSVMEILLLVIFACCDFINELFAQIKIAIIIIIESQLQLVFIISFILSSFC